MENRNNEVDIDKENIQTRRPLVTDVFAYDDITIECVIRIESIFQFAS